MTKWTLEVTNFGSISHVSLPLTGKGLCLITGENRDAPKQASNGAGKSLLLDAVSWCLWGKTIRGLKNDEVVNRHIGKNCVVKVTIEEDGTTYEITRTRKVKEKGVKPNDLVLKVNGRLPSKDSSTAEVQALITSVIGQEFETFRAMMPGAGVRLAEMTDSSVKSLLERMLQLETISAARELVKKDIRETEHERLSTERDLESTARLEEAKKESLLEYQELQNHRAEQKEQRLGEAFGKLWFLYDQLMEIQRVLGSEEDLRFKLKALTDQQNRTREDLNRLEKETQSEVASLQSVISECRSAEAVSKSNLARISKDISSFKNMSFCSVCKQEVSDAHKGGVLEQLKVEDSKHRSSLEEYVQHREELESKLRELKDSKEKSVLSYRKILTRLAQKQADVLDSVKELTAAKERAKLLSSQIAEHKDNLARIREESCEFRPLINKVGEDLKALKLEKKRLAERVALLDKQLAEQRFWTEGFSPSGLRSYVLENVLPVLNERAKYYCEKLTDNELSITFHTKTKTKTAGTKEQFRIEVVYQSGGSTYTAVSTGEKRRVDFIIALTLGDLASQRARKTIPFRFMDEPFEGIDEIGTDEVVKLLNDHRDKYDTVYVITHQPYLQQLFDTSIHVVKQDLLSTLN